MNLQLGPIETFILWEDRQATRHELVNGEIRAMVGGTANHARLIVRLGAKLLTHLQGTPCEVFTSELKVQATASIFYPDAVVTCESLEGAETLCRSPKLIVEVLSDSSSSYDRTVKRQAYQGIETLEEYVLVSQETMHFEIYRRADAWRPVHYIAGSKVLLASIGLEFPIEEMYERLFEAAK